MKINHRIAERHDDPFWREIERLGLDYERGDPNNLLGFAYSVLNVTEDQPEWPEVERLVARSAVVSHFLTNLFTKSELDAATWLVLSSQGHHGYPQPEGDGSYLQATYDVSNHCPICGIGGVQHAPFRLRAEPKAAHSQFVQLNWVFDEFFLRGEARTGLLEADISGIDFLAPVLHRADRSSEQVAQDGRTYRAAAGARPDGSPARDLQTPKRGVASRPAANALRAGGMAVLRKGQIPL